MLQVVQSDSKPRNAKIAPKIVLAPMLHGINLCAKNRRCESSRVTLPFQTGTVVMFIIIPCQSHQKDNTDIRFFLSFFFS